MQNKSVLILLISCVSLISFGQSGNFAAGGVLGVPMGMLTNSSNVGGGGFLLYQRKFGQNRFAGFISTEFIKFGEKKIYNGPYWVASKLSFLNFKIGGKWYPFKNDHIKGIFISGDVAAVASYLKGDSNIGIGTETNETDFGYEPGLGYTTKNGRLELWYNIQFVRSSGQSGNTSNQTLHYSSLKIAFNFIKS